MEIEFEEGKPDSVEDLERAKNAVKLDFIKMNMASPVFIHYTVIMRALDELIFLRGVMDKIKKNKEGS